VRAIKLLIADSAFRWRFAATLLALLCAGCGGAVEREPSLAQQAAAVREGTTDRIQLESTRLSDDDLAELPGLENLRELLLDHPDSRFTPAGIRQLIGLPNLEHLRIRGRGIDDEALAHLAKFDSLRILNVPFATFGDESLGHLKALTHLEQLRFGSPRVSDAGMPTLAELPSLKRLHLIDVRITDLGLRELARIEQLESLYLDGAIVSDESYEELFHTRPRLHVHINQQHHDRDPARQGHEH
jgi:hypothetical protein